MLVGVIDRVRPGAVAGSYVIGGWAHSVEAGQKRPVELALSPANGVELRRVHRGDCDQSVSIGFELDVSLSQLVRFVTGELCVFAWTSDHAETLALWPDCRERMKKTVLDDLLLPGAGPSFLETSITSILRALDASPSSPCGAIASGLEITAGARSLGGEVIIGEDSHLYLYKGSNSLEKQYVESPGQAAAAEAWSQIIRARDSSCRAMDAQFIQIIIPEKQSIAVNCFPGSPNRNTPTFDLIVDRLRDCAFYLDVNSEFKRLREIGQSPFRQIDSHLSIHGVTAILSLILAKIAHPAVIDMTRVRKRRLHGDLGAKFFRYGGFSEELSVPIDGYVPGTSEPILVACKDVEGHVGLERKWENPKAPISRRVTVFGNSFFERGDDPLSLSYWASRLFKTTHFIWTPVFDSTVVRDNQSDLVICQTVERFIPYIPQDK